MVKVIRCSLESCNKKLNLVDQSVGKCRCQGIFCKSHRFGSVHQCTFDLKKENKEFLTKNNPTICKEKVIKI